jgi:hypothetical protein
MSMPNLPMCSGQCLPKIIRDNPSSSAAEIARVRGTSTRWSELCLQYHSFFYTPLDAVFNPARMPSRSAGFSSALNNFVQLKQQLPP